MRIKNIPLLFSIILLLPSCSKWLDVAPKTQIASDANFSNEAGFKDALTGVYVTMSENAMYGKEMSFGFTDILAKFYTDLDSYVPEYYSTLTHEYENENFIKLRDQVWTRSYFAIANLNNLLDALSKKDSTDFEQNVYNSIKGEALALRAFIHFDMLRMFAPSPSAKPTSTPAIPYRTTYSANQVKQSTVAEVIEYALKDLNSAIALLKNNDPIVLGTKVPTTTTGYLRNRHYKFNYYAALGEKARVHLYAGNMDSAREAAMEVISSGKFPLATAGTVGSGILPSEVMFNVNVNTLETLTTNFYNYTMYGSRPTAQWQSWYETNATLGTDYRYTLFISTISGSVVVRKLYAVNNTSTNASRIPLMRVSEMNYIVAESYMKSDRETAVTWLEKVRTARGINSPKLSTSISESGFIDELVKEYQKDLICEGQLFYLYKRLNLAAYPNDAKFTANDYVLPMPDDELAFGLIK